MTTNGVLKFIQEGENKKKINEKTIIINKDNDMKIIM